MQSVSPSELKTPVDAIVASFDDLDFALGNVHSRSVPSRESKHSSSTSNINDFNDDDDDEQNEQGSHDNVLEVVNVHKTYLLGAEGVPALRGVSVNVRRGELLVLLGKSGGGKTSLLNIMGTIDRPTKGHVVIDTHKVTSTTTDAQLANIRLRTLGFVFQSFNLISSMTALQNVSLPMILDGRLSTDQIKARATALLSGVGLSGRLDHLPSQLSGGEQQRVTIARALANHPPLLLLDEPTGDLDSQTARLVLSILMRLNRKHGLSLVLVTHDQDIRNLAHRVLHVNDGKIVREELVPEEVRQEAEAALQHTHTTQQANVRGTTELRDPAKFYAFPTHPPKITLGAR